MIDRPRHLAAIRSSLANNPVCTLSGTRQSGKTALARELIRGRKQAHVSDLETAGGQARMTQPELTLSPLSRLVVIDEVQRDPRLFF